MHDRLLTQNGLGFCFFVCVVFRSGTGTAGGTEELEQTMWSDGLGDILDLYSDNYLGMSLGNGLHRKQQQRWSYS